jgi:prepilin-type N-terminal cleavage/methylation domain-containing protein
VRARTSHPGFTLVEILLVMGLIAIIGGLTTINLIQPQRTASLSGTVATLVADLRGQQIKAMGGDKVSASTAQAHGLHVQSDRYTLFKGTTYSGADTDNFVVMMDPGITLSTTNMPSSQLVFTKGTGAVTGFTSAPTITVSSDGDSNVISLNRHGVVSIN